MDNSSVPMVTIPDNSGTYTVFEQFYDGFKQVNQFLTPLLCIFGILGNCAGLVIFIRDTGKRKMIIYHYLTCLFIFDSIYMLMSLFFLLLELIEHLQLVDNNYISVLCGKYQPYLDISLNHVSSASLILMSLERMVAIRFPFKVSNFILTRFPKICIISLIIFSFGYTIPFLIAFRINSVTTPLNTTVYFISVNPEYQRLILVTTSIETFILHYVAPVLVFMINVMIIVSYSRHISKRDQIRSSNSANDSQLKVTAVIVTVSFLYILLSLPNMFIQTLILFDKDYTLNGRYKLTVLFFFEAGDLLFTINASSDFFIYVLVSSQYRTALRSWLCWCSGRKDSNELDVFSNATRDTRVNGSSNTEAVEKGNKSNE